MNSKCNKRGCNKAESLFSLTMQEVLETEEPDALGKAQHTSTTELLRDSRIYISLINSVWHY